MPYDEAYLPVAAITRIVKDSIPQGMSVAKEARLSIVKAASVFVLYTTSAANDIVARSNKKTVTATDVINAMEDIEFPQFKASLEKDLIAFRANKLKKRQVIDIKADSTHATKRRNISDDVSSVKLMKCNEYNAEEVVHVSKEMVRGFDVDKSTTGYENDMDIENMSIDAE